MLQSKLLKMGFRERFTYLQKEVGWVTIPCRMKWNKSKMEKEVYGIPKNWSKLKTLAEVEPYFKYSNNACILRTGEDVNICGTNCRMNLLSISPR